MTTIFMDESGYTGQDLLDTSQRFFCLATHSLSEQECQERVARIFSKVKAPELKYKQLTRSGNYDLILRFLEELAWTPKQVKVKIYDKRYELTMRIVQNLIQPIMKKQGNDLRIKGQDKALAYNMYQL